MRQYIGPRYMPKFMGTHDPTTAYEALSVVDNGMGTSYVSNIPVPVGIPLTDSNYWTVYGSPSGAILNLQNQINRLDTFADLKNKTIAVFGSSNEVDGYSGGDNWVTLLANMLDGYTTVVNKSVPGQTVLQSIDDFIADPDNSTYDYVLFTSVRNLYRNQGAGVAIDYDNFGLSGIETKMALLKNYSIAGQKIFFASCLPFVDDFKTFPMCVYDGTVKRGCERFGYRMLDMHSWLGVCNADSNPLTVDGLHYKSEYMPTLALCCLKALLKGNEPYVKYTSRLYNSDIASWPALTFAGGVGISSGKTSVIMCDTDLNFRGCLRLINNSGYDLTVGQHLLDLANSAWWLARPANTFSPIWYQNVVTLTEYRERAFSWETLTLIPDGNDFTIQLGVINTCQDIM